MEKTIMKQVNSGQKKFLGKGKARGWKAVMILVLAVMMVCLGACGASGGPYAVTIGGVEVRPGVTTMQELEDAGYRFADGIGVFDKDENGILTNDFIYPNAYDLNSLAEANTIYIGIALVKDKKKVADVTIVNESTKSTPLSECKIESVKISFDDYEADKTSVEGIDFDKLSEDAVTEAVGKAAKTPNYGYDCTWKRGKYNLDFKYNEDGTLESVISNYVS